MAGVGNAQRFVVGAERAVEHEACPDPKLHVEAAVAIAERVVERRPTAFALQSLLGDYYPVNQRSKVFGVYQTGQLFGFILLPLVLVTWLYIVWSIVPVVIAIQFSFNDGRSVTAWQGFSLTRWDFDDPENSVWNDPALLGALIQSLKLAALSKTLRVDYDA